MTALEILLIVISSLTIVFLIYYIYLFKKNWQKSKIFAKSIFNDTKKYLFSFLLLVILFCLVSANISGLITSSVNGSQGLNDYALNSKPAHFNLESDYVWSDQKNNYSCDNSSTQNIKEYVYSDTEDNYIDKSSNVSYFEIEDILIEDENLILPISVINNYVADISYININNGEEQIFYFKEYGIKEDLNEDSESGDVKLNPEYLYTFTIPMIDISISQPNDINNLKKNISIITYDSNGYRTNCQYSSNVLGGENYDKEYKENDLDSNDYDPLINDPFLNASSSSQYSSQTTKALNKTIDWFIKKQQEQEYGGTINDFIFNYYISAQFEIDITNTEFVNNYNLENPEEFNNINIMLYRAPQNINNKWKDSYNNQEDNLDIDIIGNTYNLQHYGNDIEYIYDINSSEYDNKAFVMRSSQVIEPSDFYKKDSQNKVKLIPSNTKIVEDTTKGTELEIVQTDLQWIHRIESELYPYSFYDNDTNNVGPGFTYFIGIVNYDTFNSLFKELSKDDQGNVNYDAFNFDINVGFKSDYISLENGASVQDLVSSLSTHYEFIKDLSDNLLNGDIYVENEDPYQDENAVSGHSSYLGDITDYIYGYGSYEFSNTYNLAIIIVMFILIFLVGFYIVRVSIRSVIKRSEKSIGTLKALGYKSENISFAYSFYPLAALLIGGILGIALSLFFVQFWISISSIYVIIPVTVPFFTYPNLIIALIFPIVVLTVYGYYKTNKTLSTDALSLINKSSLAPNALIQKLSKYGKSWKFEISYSFSTVMKSIGKFFFMFIVIFFSSFMLVISLIQLDLTTVEAVNNLALDTITSVIIAWTVIIITLTFILIAILMNDVILNLRKESSILKALGYSTNRTTIMTLLGFGFLFLLAFLFTVPTLIGLQALINWIITLLSSGPVSATFIIPAVYYIYSFLIVIGMIAISYISWYFKLKKINPAEALKID